MVDKHPVTKTFIRQDWQFLLEYYHWKYGKPLKPVQRHNRKSIPEDTACPHYGPLKKTESFSAYINASIQSVPAISTTLKKWIEDYDKNKYKLHYIYRKFTVDFFAMDLNSLPENASSLKFSKHNSHVISLCLTLHINLGLSLRKTPQALKDLYNISRSHQQITNYCRTAAVCIKPFVDHYGYKSGRVFTADEAYIKVRGIKAYIWFIMDTASHSIIGYQASD